MSDNVCRIPLLDRLYQQYLLNEDSADFVTSVSSHYTIGTLERLAVYGARITRRAAVLAISYLGDWRCNAVVGRALCDSDRAVRMIADHGIRRLWYRMPSEQLNQWLEKAQRLNLCRRFEEASETCDLILNQDATIAEAWYQRSIANYALEEFEIAICDANRALEHNPFHYAAAIGLGHVHLQLDDVFNALDCFRKAVAIQPDLESVRMQIDQLEKMLKEL
jgi:tetratricopeptide (TPR) repeat protein